VFYQGRLPPFPGLTIAEHCGIKAFSHAAGLENCTSCNAVFSGQGVGRARGTGTCSDGASRYLGATCVCESLTDSQDAPNKEPIGNVSSVTGCMHSSYGLVSCGEANALVPLPFARGGACSHHSAPGHVDFAMSGSLR
jgi:hypothetical protein